MSSSPKSPLVMDPFTACLRDQTNVNIPKDESAKLKRNYKSP